MATKALKRIDEAELKAGPADFRQVLKGKGALIEVNAGAQLGDYKAKPASDEVWEVIDGLLKKGALHLELKTTAGIRKVGEAVLGGLGHVNINIKVIEPIMERCAYQGFDARLIMGVFVKKGIMARRDDILLDALSIIGIYCMRGTSILKPEKLNRTSEEGKKDISTYVGVYGLRPEAGNDPAALTVGRIAACLPNIVCSILHSDGGKVTGKVPRGYRWLCNPQAPACIPVAAKGLRRLHLRWAKTFADQIKAQDSTDEKRAQFYEIINKGSYLTTATREALVESWNGDLNLSEADADKIEMADDPVGGAATITPAAIDSDLLRTRDTLSALTIESSLPAYGGTAPKTTTAAVAPRPATAVAAPAAAVAPAEKPP